MTIRRAFSCGVNCLLAAVLAVPSMAQTVGPPPVEGGPPQMRRERTAEDSMTAEQRQALAKKQNEQRQADIKKDTDKLLELATELKDYVDKTNENVLSMDVVKKADQIEKLAKSVKEKMKGQ